MVPKRARRFRPMFWGGFDSTACFDTLRPHLRCPHLLPSAIANYSLASPNPKETKLCSPLTLMPNHKTPLCDCVQKLYPLYQLQWKKKKNKPALKISWNILDWQSRLSNKIFVFLPQITSKIAEGEELPLYLVAGSKIEPSRWAQPRAHCRHQQAVDFPGLWLRSPDWSADSAVMFYSHFYLCCNIIPSPSLVPAQHPRLFFQPGFRWCYPSVLAFASSWPRHSSLPAPRESAARRLPAAPFHLTPPNRARVI